MESMLPPNCDFVVESVAKVIDDNIEYVDCIRCKPHTRGNLLTLKQMGDTVIVSFVATRIAPGVNTKAVAEYNRLSGWRTGDRAEAKNYESMESSLNRTKRQIRELVACNPWVLFVTITLAPDKWNRDNPDGLQYAIKEIARQWRTKQINGNCPYRSFKYLFVPEPHADGALHLHGFLTLIPKQLLVPYTLADMQRPLPLEIIEKIQAGKAIYHCTLYDERFGYNLVEPIDSRDKLAAYATKYVTKEIGVLPLKSRYWHSRGLSRAQPLATFQVPDDPEAESFARDLLQKIATKGTDGKPMYTEAYKLGDSGLPYFVSSTAYINTAEFAIEDLLSCCSAVFPKRS